MNIIALSIILFIVSCGNVLVKDSSMSSFDANFTTAEFSVCGEVHHGLAICSIEEGELYSNLNLNIQGYYNGQIKISSPDCLLSSPEVLRYTSNQTIPVVIAGRVIKSCVIEFVVMPEYPNADKTPIEIHNFKGLVYIKKIPKGSYIIAKSFKVKQLSNIDISINVKEYNGEARLVFFGCESSFDSTITFTNGRYNFNLSDIMPLSSVRSCILNGALIMDDTQIRLSYLINVYDRKFNQLSVPSLKIKKNKLHVNANSSVSVISLDKEYVMKRKVKFKFKHDQNHILRLMTVKGRSVIGLWDIDNQRFKWIQ